MKPYRIIIGDVRASLASLPDASVQLCMTSPPYWALRSYLPSDHASKSLEMGSEPTPEAYIAGQVEVFRAVRRVLRDDGVLVVNYGDSLQNKNMVCIPWRVALALQADGWYLRSAMPWVKRSAMPESVTDRPASAVEYVFLLAKSARYYWDSEAVKAKLVSPPHAPGNTAIRGDGHLRNDFGTEAMERTWGSESGRNFRNADLWFQSIKGPHGLCGVDDELVGLDVTAEPTNENHFAAYPSRLVEPFVKAGTSERGCCPTCGTPWERQIERTRVDGGPKWAPNDGNRAALGDLSKTSVFVTGLRLVTATLNWQPGCTCPAHEPVPCTVLDPFNGTGTTGAVALRHGRHYVGIELFEEHAEATRRRMERTLKPHTHRADTTTDSPLFTEAP